MGCVSVSNRSDYANTIKRDRFSFEVIPPSEIDDKNDNYSKRVI
jgi:hypothetical protein